MNVEDLLKNKIDEAKFDLHEDISSYDIIAFLDDLIIIPKPHGRATSDFAAFKTWEVLNNVEKIKKHFGGWHQEYSSDGYLFYSKIGHIKLWSIDQY